jgi:hypothetical protein
MDRRCFRRISVQGAESKPQICGVLGVGFVDWRTATACEETAHPRARLPTGQKVVSLCHLEFIVLHTSRSAEARTGMFAASPTVTVGHWTAQNSIDLIAHAPACTRPGQHEQRVLRTEPSVQTAFWATIQCYPGTPRLWSALRKVDESADVGPGAIEIAKGLAVDLARVRPPT